MQFRLDQLGKNILREFFVLVGTAETEVEVPPGDAQRIDLWHIPNPEMLRAHPEIEPGLLRAMAEEPGLVEVYSGAPDLPEFHECMRKRYQWHHTLELRDKRRLPLPAVWLVCAGRPDGVLHDFGFVQDAAGPQGLYGTSAPGWRVRVVVTTELPRVRSTVLLRLLGSARTRKEAQRDLRSLPEDAWERRLALPWLGRLSFEVPEEALLRLPAEEREWIMETREWYEQTLKQAEERGRKEAREWYEQTLKQAEERGQSQHVARLYGKRLGRPLTDAERETLTARLERLGEDRVDEVLLSFSADALAAWLADPNAQ